MHIRTPLWHTAFISLSTSVTDRFALCLQAVSRCVAEQGRVVRLPVHILDAMKRIKSVRASLAAGKEGRSVTHEEVAQVLGIPASKVAFYEKVCASPLLEGFPVSENRLAEGPGNLPGQQGLLLMYVRI